MDVRIKARNNLECIQFGIDPKGKDKLGSGELTSILRSIS